MDIDHVVFYDSEKNFIIQRQMRELGVSLQIYSSYWQLLKKYLTRPAASLPDAPEAKPVYRSYKDRVFRLLFQDKKRLLELYNALNDTQYTNIDDLEINTLDNAIFMNMKNDVSFIIDFHMNLYEHQSSYCPNMPLRGLLYLADLYKKILGSTELSGRTLIKIPTPQFIVFYNGIEHQEDERIQKLSDAYTGKRPGCLELTVRMININYGHNRALMEKCKALSDYAAFIACIRKNLESMTPEPAVRLAVNTCIEQNILKEFLLEQKSEVIAMSIYEYDEEKAHKYYFSEGYTDGQLYGKSCNLMDNVTALMKNLNVGLAKACELLGVTEEDYNLALQKLS